MGSSVGSILKIAAPVILSIALPGLGTAIGTAIDGAVGLGLGAAGEAALGGAVLGAGTGLLTGGGVKGALEGAVTGGAGGYIGGGGLSSAPDSGTFFAPSGASAGNVLTAGGFTAGGNAIDLSTPEGQAALSGGALQAGANGVTAGVAGTGFLSPYAQALGGSGTTGIAGSGITGGQFLNGASSIYSGIQNSDAIKQAAQQQEAANQQALQQQAQQYATTSANETPFITAGQQASNTLATLSGTNGNTSAAGYGSLTAPFNPGDLTQTPGYQFELQQGTKAMNNSLAAQGLSQSGAALKEAQQFGQGLADTTYNTAYQQYLQGNAQNANILGSQIPQGTGAASALGGTGTSMANTTSGLITQGGNIQGASTLGQNNSLTTALGGSIGALTGLGGNNTNIDPLTGQPKKNFTLTLA